MIGRERAALPHLGKTRRRGLGRRFEKALGKWPDDVWAAFSLVFAFARSGQPGEAETWIADLEKRSETSWVPPAGFGLAHAALGDSYTAFFYQVRDFWLVMLNVEPLYDPLRSDPRFDDLVKRVGIPDQK